MASPRMRSSEQAGRGRGKGGREQKAVVRDQPARADGCLRWRHWRRRSFLDRQGPAVGASEEMKRARKQTGRRKRRRPVEEQRFEDNFLTE
ncbi:hypothetical protein MUK42_16205 [Musa troglodytarum]|uniref:Uncharacterized protein n=1 Tax=Musa troglodytarum TaxID=320322 RepID=A0A9E7L958_9LILI|nr:hypothetical protein MUK42_16205 [Musa troglodytarum]